MATKDVYLGFLDGRVKLVQLVPRPNRSDWDGLRNMIAAMRDLNVPPGRGIVFQTERTKKDGTKIHVDIDEVYVKDVEDEADIRVVFSSPPQTPAIQGIESGVIEIVDNGMLKETDVVLLPLDVDTDSYPSRSPDRNELENTPVPTPEPTPDPTSNAVSTECVENNPNNKKKKNHTEAQPRYTFDTVPAVDLPELTPEMKNLVEQGKTREKTAKFISFYGDALWEMTHCPSQGAYNSFGRSICARHKELVDPTVRARPQALVCKLLSIYFRNKRKAFEKLCEPEVDSPSTSKKMPTFSSLGAGVASKCKKRRVLSEPSAHEENEISPFAVDDLESLQHELDRVRHTGATTHVIRLLKESFSLRKIKIQSLGTASQVVVQYPHLLQSELILHELCLRVHVELPDIINTLDYCLSELAEAFKATFQGSDMLKAESFVAIQNRAKPKNISSKAAALVTLQKVLSTPNLTCEPGDAPRLVLYFLEDGCIAASFILADGLKMKVDKYNFTKTLLTLLGVYHAWNVGYPVAYKNIFDYLDDELFAMIPRNPNTAYRKLKKNCGGIKGKEKKCLTRSD